MENDRIDIPPGLLTIWERALLRDMVSPLPPPYRGKKCPFIMSSHCTMQKDGPFCTYEREDVPKCPYRQEGIEKYLVPMLKRRQMSEGEEQWGRMVQRMNEALGGDYILDK